MERRPLQQLPVRQAWSRSTSRPPTCPRSAAIAGQIETLLLNETPIIFAYFYNYLTATAMGVTGVYPTAIGHLFLYNAAKS